MTHPSFSHEQSLPSLKVTKDFLHSLEQYFVKRVVDASIVSQEEASKLLSIKIEDSLGSETIASISQVTASRFADSTSRIEVELATPYKPDGTRLRVRLNFSRGRLFSTLAISATMPNARELALGLKDGLLRMLEPQKTWHWIAHPTAQVWGALFAGGVWIGYFLFQASGKEAHFPYLLGSFALVWIYLFGMGSLRSYTVFDSRASERADKIWGWFIGGVATFLLFGTLLTLFRRPLLGS